MSTLRRTWPWALALLLCTACRPGGPSDDGAAAGEEDEVVVPVPVEIGVVATADLRRAVSASTTLRSAVEVSVLSEISGTARAVSVDEGDTVEAGAALARLENDEVRSAIEEAAQLVARNRNEVERLRPLFDQGFLARQTFEEATFQLETAETALRRARDRAAGQQVDAPIAGVVIERGVERGELVVPNQLLFRIAQVRELEAVIAVPERELARLAVGQVAEVEVAAFEGVGVPLVGHVRRIEPVVDPQTGTVEVRVAVEPPDDAALPSLRPGMFTTVRIVTDVREGVPAVPKRALVREADQVWVYRVGAALPAPEEGSGDDEIAFADLTRYAVERVAVTLGYEDRDVVEVVDGLVVGDRIVVVGQSGLDPSAQIVIPEEGSGGRP